MKVVVDTNIVACFWLPGAHTESAVALRLNTDELFVSTLWRSGIRNILARYLRAGTVGPRRPTH
ncbi:MAG: hypothetical protein J4F47_00825 [Alphaproteobacteria bacterium]|nr:hypothetical protein [Alphaproteobacteria bacterium]